MQDLYFAAAWTESSCLLGCEHHHNTVTSAVACTAFARSGAFVLAVENGKERWLSDSEEAEFQYAMYGRRSERRSKTTVLDRIGMFVGIQTQPK